MPGYLYLLAYTLAMEVLSGRVCKTNFAVPSPEKPDRVMNEVKRQLTTQESADTSTARGMQILAVLTVQDQRRSQEFNNECVSVEMRLPLLVSG